MKISQKYEDFCVLNGIPFQNGLSIGSYDDTTLFCPAGMQQFKSKFKSPNGSTIGNIQPCLRLNDFDQIGDGTHFLYFNMMGLFSFKDKSVQWTIDFWLDFLNSINVVPDYFTIHPDKKDWIKYYPNCDVRLDSECIWSDGDIGGYCTEFYKNGIEIGNIVNPLGESIDVGFGLERLEIFHGLTRSKEDILRESVIKIVNSGYRPGNLKQGYVLRKLLRECFRNNITIDHEFYHDEVKRQEKIVQRYNKLKDRNLDKSPEWWYDTHGIDLSLLD